MSTLVLPLPDRPRLAAAPTPPTGTGYDWWLLADDGSLLGEGHDQPAALPKSTQLVLLLPEQGVSWHRVTLPRAPAKRWRAALVGLLEEALLEDPDQLHLALEATAVAGAETWVAATAKAPLQEAIERLEGAQRLVDRIVPRSAPTAQAQGHFLTADGGVQLRWCSAEGVALLPLAGGFARARFPLQALPAAEWSASADAAAAAEAWLGRHVPVSGAAQQAARALASPWNLRQFELAPRLHGLRWLRQARHQLMARQWRAARIGLAVWLGLGLLGLNASAWQQRRAIEARQQQLSATLKGSFPRVSYVAEPLLQMQRELDGLRAQAGELGEQDLESLLSVLAAGWPDARGPVEALNFEPGQLSWPASGWSDAQIEELRRMLASEGWQLGQDTGRLTLRKAKSTP